MEITFERAKTKREEIPLPQLYFVAMDQWLDVIGEKAFLAWLKFYTWCDRDKEHYADKELNLWEQSNVNYSLKYLSKKLGVGNDTFYNKILKPLWNVGLIDIKESDRKINGTKPMNIIVYQYPQNDKSLSFAELKAVRNYDTDYSSTAKTFAKLGGRPKKDVTETNTTNSNDIEALTNEVDSQMEQMFGGFSNRTGGVLVQNGGASLTEQGGVLVQNRGGSEIGDNNLLNIFNLFNSFSNNFNKVITILNNNNLNNSSSSNNLNKEISTNKEIKKEEEENYDSIRINKFTILTLKEHFNDYVVEQIIKEMKARNITSFTEKQIHAQLKRNELYVIQNKKQIGDMGKFFVNGILQYEPSEEILERDKKVKELQEQKKEINNNTNFNPNPYKPTFPFYNWLDN